MNLVRRPQVGRNAHDQSHTVAMSGKFGFLYPTLCKEVLPGETVHLKCEQLVRMMPLVNPVMHKFNVSTHYFFVPNRLCWANWEKFITHREDGSQPAHPFINIGGDILGEPFYPPLADYMGIPKPPTPSPNISIPVDAMPFMAYQKVWFEYYRDQNNIELNINNTIPDTLSDGDNSANVWLWPLRKRAWMHDYFTSCLPQPQAGPAIEIPFGAQDVPVRRNTDTVGGEFPVTIVTTTVPTETMLIDNVQTPDVDVDDDELYVPLTNIDTTATINDLRIASALQRFMERLLTGGRRYAEVIRSFFGAKPQDSRLQRPEYITGTKTPIVISEVLNTTGTEELPQGNMSGHGLAVTGGGYNQTYTAQEHGWIIAVSSVMPDTAYENGLPRKFFPKVFTDYFWPEFADLGEDVISVKELYAYHADSDDPFGYLPRYARYRTEFNRVCGQMRQGESLTTWTFGRQFTSPPALNEAFIECTPGKRIFADTAEEDDELVINIQHNILSLSPVPKFSTPVLK